MRKWKVDKYCIGDPVDFEVSTEAEVLADVLQCYENKGAKIQQIIWRDSHMDYLVIYTIEDEECINFPNQYGKQHIDMDDRKIYIIPCSNNSCNDCDFYNRVLTKEGTYVGDTPCDWCNNNSYKVTSQMQEKLKSNTASSTNKSNKGN